MGVRNHLSREQMPKTELIGSRRRKGTCYCRECRRDVPKADVNHETCTCHECEAAKEQRIRELAKYYDQEQLARVKAGKAYFNSRGNYVEF